MVVDPGPPLQPAAWAIEVRGPLDVAALRRALGGPASGEPGRRHRLVRLGPEHHKLRLTDTGGESAATLAGRVADLLTRPPAADQPLSPAQCAVLARAGAHRYEAVYLEPATAPDAAAVRNALRTVLTAHPQLCARLDATGARLTGHTGVTAPAPGQDPLVEADFADEDDFTAAVTAVGRTLDPSTGIRLRALLARDRRPRTPRATPRTDRLAVLVDELAVDDTSWHILLDDLTTALTENTTPDAHGTAPDADETEAAVQPAPEATPPTPTTPPPTRGGLGEWVGKLRELAADPEEGRHWGRVAERRARVVGARWAAAGQRRAVDAAEGAGPAGLWDGGDGTERQFGFVVERGTTERIVHGLARRFALTAGQVLTGVFAVALARWQRADEIGIDVRSDPRTEHPGLRRHVGRLTDLHPVQLTLDPLLDPLEQLAAVSGALAAGAGHAEGGAGFGACREWSPDPLLRDALHELPPAQACLTLPGPGETPPAVPVRPVPGHVTPPPAYPVHARMRIVGGRLHVGLEWTPVPAEGINETSVGALTELLRQLLGELADASTAPIPSAFRATPQQSALYKGGDARPGTGRHVEQVVWVWHGPLDVERFTAAWQSVFDRETVLRTAFTGGADPQLMVHSRVAPEITIRFHRGEDLFELLERDRLRGFDLRCPGALRLTLLATDGVPRPGAPTRIVLTYHRALLDNWSAHILLREFYRAYLAGGSLPGGERRPDLRDYTAWIAAQDLGPARGFWALSAPPDGTAATPGRPAGATGLTGVGRSRLRLDPAETIRLAHWAGRWGITESGVLQAVWAMLIYRASGATAPAPVCFAVTVPGRGIPLDGVSRMLGPLRNSLPMSVEVDPAATVPALLRQLRDRALDMAGYEWVPCDWIHGRPEADVEPVATMIVFEDPPHPVEGLDNELAAQGLGADFPGTVPARSVLPIGLLAHHDKAGGLVFTGVHDRAVLDEDAAAELLVQSALLLRELPLWARESTTVADALKLLEGRAVPPLAEPPAADGPDKPLVTLRAAKEERAGTICLVRPPGAPATCYDLFGDLYTGPQELLVLTADAAAPDLPALRAATAGRALLLGGFSGAGALACDVARHLTADGGRPPRVVLAGGSADERDRTLDLARALTAAARTAAPGQP
ncbi:condensation domain-containing protein [Streptomyces sp. TLI_55]|nr:condensation domain-containing protein [Streptomyces sp. TLI_55]